MVTPHTSVCLRVVLRGREVLRLPAGARGVRVRTGRAWLSVNGEDVILTRHTNAQFKARAADPALLSALGEAPVMVEILGEPGGGSPDAFVLRPSLN